MVYLILSLLLGKKYTAFYKHLVISAGTGHTYQNFLFLPRVISVANLISNVIKLAKIGKLFEVLF